MRGRKIGDDWMVRLERGEEVVSTLDDFLREEGIEAGSLQGLGSVNRAVLAYYEMGDQRYHSETFRGTLEVVSVLGTITREGAHLHAVVTDTDMKASGGHLVEADVSGTLEVAVHPIGGVIDRETEEQTGLNLMDL